MAPRCERRLESAAGAKLFLSNEQSVLSEKAALKDVKLSADGLLILCKPFSCGEICLRNKKALH